MKGHLAKGLGEVLLSRGFYVTGHESVDGFQSFVFQEQILKLIMSQKFLNQSYITKFIYFCHLSSFSNFSNDGYLVHIESTCSINLITFEKVFGLKVPKS